MDARGLTSARLAIAPLAVDDIPAFVAYRREPDVARYQSWTVDYSTADAEALVAGQATTDSTPFRPPIAGEWVQLGLRPHAPDGRGEIVGDVAIGADSEQPDTYELGVTIAPRHQGFGYAHESLDAVIAWLMDEHGAHRIVMQGDARNAAVLALIRRLGLRREGSIVEGDWFKGEWTTLERFALLAREWRAR